MLHNQDTNEEFQGKNFHMRPMTRFERNWRVLAWQRWPQLPWPERLERLGLPLEDLTSPTPHPETVQRIEGRFHAEHLQHVDLLTEQNIDILAQNLRYLLGNAPHGTLGRLARRLGVSLSTVSRWAAGETHPRETHLRVLHSELHLDADLDLTTTPLFLWEAAFTHEARVQQIHRWVDTLPAPTLQVLYPALERLLRETPDAL